jgi:putative membrane protein
MEELMQTWMKWALCATLVLPTAVWAQTSAGHPGDKKTDTVETASGKRTSTTADTTFERKFIDKAASGGMAEVNLGKLAMEKGSSPTVKQFGLKMVEDHGKANDELKAIAEKKNLPIPTDVDTEQKATYDKLAKLSGADFDKAYMDAMVKDHDEDVKEFKHATAAPMDPDVKAWAKKTLAVIEQHDHIAHQDKSALKK